MYTIVNILSLQTKVTLVTRWWHHAARSGSVKSLTLSSMTAISFLLRSRSKCSVMEAWCCFGWTRDSVGTTARIPANSWTNWHHSDSSWLSMSRGEVLAWRTSPRWSRVHTKELPNLFCMATAVVFDWFCRDSFSSVANSTRRWRSHVSITRITESWRHIRPWDKEQFTGW